MTRAMRMCQANNQTLGSPSNRVNIFARTSRSSCTSVKSVLTFWLEDCAAAGLTKTRPSLREIGLREWSRDLVKESLFRTSLVAVDVGFILLKVGHLLLLVSLLSLTLCASNSLADPSMVVFPRAGQGRGLRRPSPEADRDHGQERAWHRDRRQGVHGIGPPHRS